MEVLTQNQIEDIFWRATVKTIGLDPDAAATQNRVRISWPKPGEEGTTWHREDNVIFLRITPTYDDYTIQKDITHVYDSGNDTLKEVVDYHRVFSIQWVCYGPESGEDVDAIRIGILRTEVRKYLRQNGIGMKPDIREPVRIPEPDESGDWWERNDLTAQCYILFSRDYEEGIIEHVPVSVSDARGEVQIVVSPYSMTDISWTNEAYAL